MPGRSAPDLQHPNLRQILPVGLRQDQGGQYRPLDLMPVRHPDGCPGCHEWAGSAESPGWFIR